MNPSSRRLVRAMSCVVALAAALPIDGLRAQPGFPDKPVHLVVATAAGGAMDATARNLADKLAIRLGQPIVVRESPGRRQLAGRAAGCTLGARWVHAALRVLGILDAAGALSAIAVCAERPHCGGSGRLGALCVRGPAGRAVSHHEGVHRLREEPAEAVEHRLRRQRHRRALAGCVVQVGDAARDRTHSLQGESPALQAMLGGQLSIMPVTVSLGTR